MAVELADIGRAAREQDSVDAELRRRFDDETVATLRQALENGYVLDAKLTDDERFALLRDNKQFGELMAELSDTGTTRIHQ